MRASACSWQTVENDKIFESHVKIFEFSQVNKIVESRLVYVNRFS